MAKSLLFTQKIRQYQGKYVAVVADKIVASGRNAKETFELAKKILGRKKPTGIYYVPSKKDLLTAYYREIVTLPYYSSI